MSQELEKLKEDFIIALTVSPEEKQVFKESIKKRVSKLEVSEMAEYAMFLIQALKALTQSEEEEK